MLTRLTALCLRRYLHTDRDVEATQRRVLRELVEAARATEWGRHHHYRYVRTYEQYVRHVDTLMPYERLRPYVMRMLAGEADVLAPGRCRSFAQSSGTSDGRSKYIPVTDASLRNNHFRGPRSVVAHYLANVPSSRLFSGKAFILGGSFANEVHPVPGICVGDLSATLIARMPRFGEWFRVPRRHIALLEDWRVKLPALVDASLQQRNITSLSGVPSWFLTVLQHVLQEAGATCIHDVWPQLEVFFHGGIAFGPYRDQYRRITDPGRMHYLETYNASEGFFALQSDLADPGLLLLTDAAIFYEFIPEADLDSDDPRLLPVWQLTAGERYALVVTGANGLWRYPVGDVVQVTSVSPLKIVISGRTKSYINAFGEEVMVYNTDRALEHAQHDTGIEALNYTVAPLYAHEGHRGCHQWLIETRTTPSPALQQRFAAILDEALRRENSDYDAKRTSDIFLKAPDIVWVPEGTFDRWLQSTGKLGGQRKVPRLSNDRRVLDAILNLLR